MINEIYGNIHKWAKIVLKRRNMDLSQYRMISFKEKDFDQTNHINILSNDEIFINESTFGPGKVKIEKSNVYPVENLVPLKFDRKFKDSFVKKRFKASTTKDLNEAINAWKAFIDNSKIPMGYKNAGLHYAGYIKEFSQWCLPSWIWINAALVRYYCSGMEIDKAESLAKIIMNCQDSSGGWIVRNDYSTDGVIPELAPNDSAYIANNCFLSLYKVTNKEQYLTVAKATADWIIETAREDGFVFFGYDKKKNEWIKDRNIVDTGFTAALFANLYEITKLKKYLDFLSNFVQIYIKLFYIKESKCFATAIDGNDRQKGGAFGRGQAWALEGLIPAYRVLGGKELKEVIQATIDTLLQKQSKDGGWYYNLMKPLMGTDCKATSVIAKSIMEWYKINPERTELIKRAERALDWCIKHTANSGEGKGGIFSYTIEGAVVHHLYTNTAFVYASSYALEVCEMLSETNWR